MLLSTPLPASSSFARLLPYAKAHDKLQLALLSLEVEEAKLDSAQEQLERLRHEEASIKSQLNLLAEARALLANKHGSNSPDEHLNDGNDVIRISVSLVSEKDHRLHQNVSGFYDQWERKMLDSLAKLRKKIEQCLIAASSECESEKRISYKPELLRFIEELYSSVFDGVTPDFPHEDRVEELVELAELALEHKKMIQSSVLYEPGLAKLDGSNIKAHQAIFGLELGTNTYIQQCSSNMVTHYFPEIQLWKHCEFVGVTFAALRDAIRKYLEKRPDSLLLQFGSTVKDIVPLVDADSLYNFIVRAGVSQDGKYEVKRKVNLLLKGVTEISELLRLSIHINEKRHLNAQNAVDAATVILKLRRHQLASIRCQILDFIVNPQNCLPEEDLIGNPPRYSPAISYGDFTRLDPTVPQLLERAEGCPREDHVKAAVESRLSRIKRMMHAGAIRVECFVAPEYVQTNDLQSAQKHPESIDSRETLAYQDILALEKIAGNARCAEEAVYADLDLLTVQARRCGLLPLVRPRAII